MVSIVVNDEQAKIIRDARDCVLVHDAQGRFVGYVRHGFEDADVEAAKQVLTSDAPRYTTAQVLGHLENLDRK
jgi:hypothetical protein